LLKPRHAPQEVNDKRQPYDVLLLRKDGATEVFAKY
jgi:hypothetical protein